jgi:rhamnose transport system substrate-binding protein
MKKMFFPKGDNIKLVALIMAAILLLPGITACTGGASNDEEHAELPPQQVYVMVSKDRNNPYMRKAYEGFEAACVELGALPVFAGPETATPEGQIEIINQLIAEDVTLIAIAANDADALQPTLQNAMNKGIIVISYDSAVNKDSRITHVQQADPEQIGRVLVQAAYEMAAGEGGIAILSATAQATNQNLWIEWMKRELAENTVKYAETPLIQILYGDDDPIKSADATEELLQNPAIKVIIAPTAVGMLAAGKYLQEIESDVLLTGLGLPSEIAPFIEAGICQWMYLWNPVDLGYLTAYTGDALVKSQVTGQLGEAFFAGSMGERVIAEAVDGGTEVMLGNPFKFDKANITEWKEVY